MQPACHNAACGAAGDQVGGMVNGIWTPANGRGFPLVQKGGAAIVAIIHGVLIVGSTGKAWPARIGRVLRHANHRMEAQKMEGNQNGILQKYHVLPIARLSELKENPRN